jgi:hypothetical protein
MTAPRNRVLSSGFGTDAGGAWTATGMSPLAAGNVIILQVLQDGNTDGAVTLDSATNIEDLAGTDNAWTKIPGANADGSFPVGSAAAARQHLWIGRSLSTSAPTATGSNSTSEDLYWRFSEFTDVNTGTTLAEVIENVTAGAATNSAGTSSTASDASVTTLGPDRLALNFQVVNDDNALSIFTGATGGVWWRSTSISESSGTDGAYAMHWCYPGAITSHTGAGMASGQAVYGGSGTNEQAAQSFSSGAGGLVSLVALSVSVTGSPTDNFIVEIQTDSSGVPSGTVVGTSVSVLASSLPAGMGGGWAYFDVAASLSASTTYWIVCRRSGSRDTTNYAVWQQNSSNVYAGGVPATKSSGTWSTATNDFGFIATLPATATIDGATGSITDSDAWGVVGFALVGTTTTSTSVARLSLAPAGTPTTRTNHSIFVRARVTSAAGTAVLRVALYEGASNRSGDLSTGILTTSLTDYFLPISDANAATITDYSDLEIRVWGYDACGRACPFEVDYVCLQTPDGVIASVPYRRVYPQLLAH